jgi:DNA-binding NarL/FixJ family response regulator
LKSAGDGAGGDALADRPAVLLAGHGHEWPAGLVASLAGEGYVVDRIPDLEPAPRLLRQRGVRALLVAARPLGANDIFILKRCRELSPHTAIVVVTSQTTQPDLKRAFESGATAFLSWPASPDSLRQALGSGEALPPGPASSAKT